MGANLISPVKSVDQLWFEPLHRSQGVKGKVYSIQGKFPAQSVVIVVGDNGKLYGNNPLSKNAAYVPGDWPWVKSVLQLMKKANLITAKAMQDHLDHCETKSKRRRAKNLLEHTANRLQEFDIRLTPTQKRKLEAAAK